ncbi:hypothetical protein RRG08_010527 [Elysia crispata]|uniref:Uncharacterized protein n=1 Tax=Elysia crispata TaxID=231223 RepID=A0AAE1AQY7_9GAST|nr:hypothetical protein RRG08_010527 [Elysia crispata]
MLDRINTLVTVCFKGHYLTTTAKPHRPPVQVWLVPGSNKLCESATPWLVLLLVSEIRPSRSLVEPGWRVDPDIPRQGVLDRTSHLRSASCLGSKLLRHLRKYGIALLMFNGYDSGLQTFFHLLLLVNSEPTTRNQQLFSQRLRP